MLEARNKNIVKLLEETTDLVENRHTGIATMKEEMKSMDLPEPEIVVSNGDFRVIFRRKDVEILSQKSGQKSGQKIIEGLNNTQIKILELLDEELKITQTILSGKLNFGRTIITRNIKKLKEKKIIERIGSDRNGYWKIL